MKVSFLFTVNKRSKIDNLANNDAYSLSVCVRKSTGDTLYIETYAVKGTKGNYTLSMLPRNVPGFEYSITIGKD
jgi:hypothetical protein